MSDREHVAEELRRIREEVRDRALLEPAERGVLPDPPMVRTPQAVPQEPEPAPRRELGRPDNASLNTLWRTASPQGGLVARAWARLLRPLLDRQQAFNSRQVQFDNELLSYVEARLDETHRHYDRVLGIHSRHMAEIDERHLILQEELVAHVHDLVKRIDMVLSQAERGRLGLEFALRDLRARVARLEERLLRE